MKVALHSAIEGFFKSKPPYTNTELLRHVRKAASLGFKCYQIGPLWRFSEIDAKRLKKTLDLCGLEANVHVGGRYDAEKFATTETEYEKARAEIHCGIEICEAVSSKLVSFHPPFFETQKPEDSTILLKARTRFLKLVSQEVEAASAVGVKMALESFCYRPFIFNDLRDFVQFISRFSSDKLGILLETGHLFNAGFDLDEAISAFKKRLVDVHIHDAMVEEDVTKGTHLPIGVGNIDFVQLVGQLRLAGYDGWLTLEINGGERQIIENRLFLENLLEET